MRRKGESISGKVRGRGRSSSEGEAEGEAAASEGFHGGAHISSVFGALVFDAPVFDGRVGPSPL
jgi:hypothetical protein